MHGEEGSRIGYLFKVLSPTWALLLSYQHSKITILPTVTQKAIQSRRVWKHDVILNVSGFEDRNFEPIIDLRDSESRTHHHPSALLGEKKDLLKLYNF